MRMHVRLLAALAVCLAAVTATAADRPPNIVVILSDDFGWGSVGCYGADGKLIQTPNLDRLAREGKRFTDANTTSSVCSPTRYSLITGRYCWRTSAKSGVLSTFSPLHIETTRLNMASLLKKHGYSTAAIGKWHLGYGAEGDAARYRTDYTAELKPGPLEIGFDYHFGVPSNHGDLTGVFVENHFVYGLRAGKIPANMALPGPQPDDDNYQPTYTRDDTESGRSDPIAIEAPRRKNDRVMPELDKKTVAWIDKQKKETPFFLYFTPVAVHNPVTPEADLSGRSAAGPYGDWIHQLDRSVGRVLDALDKNGLADNTLVIFTSDNGGVKVPTRDSVQTQALKAGLEVNGPYRGGKHSVWQGGFRVPFIVRWPGKVQPGTTSDVTVSLADLLATTAAVVGEELPPASKAAEDSYNILPAILGRPDQIRPDIIVHSSDGVFAIRKGPWKYIEGVPVPNIAAAVRKARAVEFKPQLYNLVDDPAETKDVASENAEVVNELQTLLDRYRAGGYSREMPPLPPKQAVIEMPELAKKVVLAEAFDEIAKPRWTQVRGTWTVKDGAARATQTADDKQPASLRTALAMTGGDISYKLSLPAAGSHALRLQCQERSHVLRIDVSARRVAVVKQVAATKTGDGQTKGGAGSTVAATADVNLTPGEWTPIRISFRGRDLYVAVGDKTLKLTDDWAAEKKIAAALMASGQDVGFDNVEIRE